jgi:geranylgeranyl reductase family protein
MDSDVIVIGAGPAGSTAAKFLAEMGHEVLILEKDKLPRDKACGGGVVRHIHRFDYMSDFINDHHLGECKAHKSYDRTLKYFVEYHTDDVMFYNVRRRDFDHQLVQFALESGASLEQGPDVMALDVKLDMEGVRVRTRGGDLTAKVVIGAGGAMDPVAKYIRRSGGLPEDMEDMSISPVAEYPVDQSFIEETYPDYMSYFHHGFDDSVYAWVFPKREVLNIGVWPKPGQRVNPKEKLQTYLDYLYSVDLTPEEYTVEKYMGAPLPSAGPVDVTYDHRMIIVGDAARLVSPLTGEGIYYAMESGRMAALSIDEALYKGQPTASALSPYQEMWEATFGADLRAMKSYAKQVANHGTMLIKLASEDKQLKGIFANLFMGTVGAARMRSKVMMRLAIDLPVDVLKTINPLNQIHISRDRPVTDRFEEPFIEDPDDESEDEPDDGILPPDGPGGGPVAET